MADPRMTMSENDLDVLVHGSIEDCTTVLKNFIQHNEKNKNFPHLSLEMKMSFYKGIFDRISNPSTPPNVINLLLSSLRIIVRELPTLNLALTDEYVQIILKVAKLKTNNDYVNCGDSETVEALKVVFNMIFQSKLVRSKFISNGFLEGLVTTIQTYNKVDLSWEIKYFTMRSLFIMTALCRETVPIIRNKLNGLTYIMDYILVLAELSQPYDNETVDLICEMLKGIYNLIHDIIPSSNGVDGNITDEDMVHLTTATKLVKLFLFHDLESPEKQDELQSHSIDLLAIIPYECFNDLIPPIEETNFSYDGYDMTVIEEIVEFLYRRLDAKPSEKRGTVIEMLSPVLYVLVRMAEKIRPIRKYLKLRVLPPLRKSDVLERPEVGITLRNKLCALMTSPAGPVTGLVCNFLFILVKENVKRLVKYTGFGNAAGLLANRGLLGGASSAKTGAYSSESEDSDTSEYKEVSHLINGFGWIEPERPSPCEGMTEEQKVVEAMKLVNAIDKLNRNQLIQPVQIGPDGRPQPIEHICQLLDHSNLGADSLIQSNQRQSDSSDSE